MLKKMLAPSAALMHRLRYPYKFAVIGVLALSEILFLFFPLSGNLQHAIERTHQEIYGLAVNKPMLVLIQVVQQHRGLSAAVVGGLVSLKTKRVEKEADVARAVSAVDMAVAQHGTRLKIDTRWSAARAHWQDLRSTGLRQSVDQNRAAHTALIKELLAIVTAIGDSSFLVLDPDAASYHLMDAVTINLPGTLELLGQLRAHGTSVLAAKTIDENGRIGFAGEVAVLRAKHEELDASLTQIEISSPQLAERLRDFSLQFHGTTDSILQIVSDDIVGGRLSTDPEHYWDVTTRSIDLGFEQAQTLLLPLLEQLLRERVERLEAEYYRDAALTLASMLLFAYLAAGAYVSVMSSVKTLQTGADRMATGDLATPIVLETKDELRLVASSFNHMAKELALRTDQLHQTGATLTQVQALFEKEHALAVLAVLVPSIAHDLNTPIGNANLAVSSMREMLAEFRRKLAAGGVHKSDLEGFLSAQQEGIDIVDRAGTRAAELAANLKHLSIDQVSERRRTFMLDQLLDEVMTTFKPSMVGARWKVERHVETGLMLDSYPGPLGQVLLNLIQNAAVHAFEGRDSGVLVIEACACPQDQVRITLRDDGCGMTADTLAQVFKPFFTTKINQGGSGVGLAYAQRLVNNTLGGRLEVVSDLGAGTTFSLLLPRVAPDGLTPV